MGRESELERAVEAHDLTLHAGPTGQADADVRLPCGAPGLPRSATASDAKAASGRDERD